MPEPEPFRKRCTVRAFYANADADEKKMEIENAGTIDETHSTASISSGTGFGVEGECLVTPRLGIPVAIMALSHDAFFSFDSPTEWLMDKADVDWLGVTAGLNYHFTDPESTAVDFWGGPFIGFVDFDDTRVTLGNETSNFSFDNAFTWGLQLGIEVPARQGFALYGGIRYFNLEAEVENDNLDFDLDPLMFNIGVSYRF